MPGAEFFRQAGFFVVPNFLDHEAVAQIYREMATAPKEKGLVVKADNYDCLDEDLRKVEAAVLPKEVWGALRERFRALIPELETHFHVQIAGCEPPHHLIYRPGDFFKPHSDGGSMGQSDFTRQRRVSAVIFLNPESDKPEDGTFGEGRLTFHGLLDGPKWGSCSFALKPEPGLLIAFPSETVHEVTPVSHGLRFTVVTWYYAPDPKLDQPAAEPVESVSEKVPEPS